MVVLRCICAVFAGYLGLFRLPVQDHIGKSRSAPCNAVALHRRGNVGEVLAGKDDRGAIAQLARDLDLEQVYLHLIPDSIIAAARAS